MEGAGGQAGEGGTVTGGTGMQTKLRYPRGVSHRGVGVVEVRGTATMPRLGKSKTWWQRKVFVTPGVLPTRGSYGGGRKLVLVLVQKCVTGGPWKWFLQMRGSRVDWF